ncbi:hypothetical protein ACHAXN_004396 [Cyclotella atomus]
MPQFFVPFDHIIWPDFGHRTVASRLKCRDYYLFGVKITPAPIAAVEDWPPLATFTIRSTSSAPLHF